MARKRFITSEMSTDEKIAALAEENPTAALMWPWFMTSFDDWGRMGANPMEVKLTIFPAFPYTSKDIQEAIKLFNKYGLAHYYEVDGKPYLAVNPEKWLKYQTYIRKGKIEDQKSKHPEPPNPPWEANDNANEDLATKNVANQQLATINVLSPSPSPSPSNRDHDDHDRAHEEKPNFAVTYEQEFGTLISPTIAERLKGYIDSGMPEELVCEAIRRTREQGKVSIRYTYSILDDWRNRGIINMAGVAIADQEFEQRKARGDPKRPRGREQTNEPAGEEESKKLELIRKLYLS